MKYISDKEFGLFTSKLELLRGNESREIEKKKYMGDKSLTGVVIASDVTAIAGWAFAYCEKLKTIWLPIGCNSIENTFILDVNNLRNVVVYDALLEGYNAGIEEKRLLAIALKKWYSGSSYDFRLVGEKSWYQEFDDNLSKYILEADSTGFNPFLAGGEEDYEDPLNDVEYYKETIRCDKCNVILERLMVPEHLQDNKNALYKQYLQDNVIDAFKAIVAHEDEAYEYLRLMLSKVSISREEAIKGVDIFDKPLYAECRVIIMDSINEQSNNVNIWDEYSL